MINKIFNRFYWLFKIGYKYFMFKSSIYGSTSAQICIDKSVKIINSKIFVNPDSSLIIRKGSVIQNLSININGNVVIGENNYLMVGGPINKLSFEINGNLTVGNNNRIQSRILIRYGAILSIGNYNNINQESEIRVDDSITIGSYNQISYKVVIWDTNTHSIYPAAYRRKLTEERFPVFGYEYEKPKTKPVIIGDDCWIGREAVLLKGAQLADRCVLGFRAVLSDTKTEVGSTIVTSISNKEFKNKI